MRFLKQEFSGSYDEKFDILYVYRRGRDNSYATEEGDGLVVFRSMETSAITGMIVYNFLKKLTEKEIDLDNLPIDIHSFVEELSKEL